MPKTTAVVTLESGVNVEISTTSHTHANGNAMQLDADKITLSDFFELEERVEHALGVLREHARKNTKLKPIFSEQQNVLGTDTNDKATQQTALEQTEDKPKED